MQTSLRDYLSSPSSASESTNSLVTGSSRESTVYVCVCVCLCVRACVCARAYMCVCINESTNYLITGSSFAVIAHLCVCAFLCVRVYVCVRIIESVRGFFFPIESIESTNVSGVRVYRIHERFCVCVCMCVCVLSNPFVDFFFYRIHRIHERFCCACVSNPRTFLCVRVYVCVRIIESTNSLITSSSRKFIISLCG